MNASKPATAVVEIELTARTRVVYTEHVVVPAGLSHASLLSLADELYRVTDGSEFISDPEFWERSHSRVSCIGADDGEHAPPGFSASLKDGSWEVEPITPNAGALAAGDTLQLRGEAQCGMSACDSSQISEQPFTSNERERFAKWLETDFSADAEEERAHRQYLAGLLRRMN